MNLTTASRRPDLPSPSLACSTHRQQLATALVAKGDLQGRSHSAHGLQQELNPSCLLVRPPRLQRQAAECAPGAGAPQARQRRRHPAGHRHGVVHLARRRWQCRRQRRRIPGVESKWIHTTAAAAARPGAPPAATRLPAAGGHASAVPARALPAALPAASRAATHPSRAPEAGARALGGLRTTTAARGAGPWCHAPRRRQPPPHAAASPPPAARRRAAARRKGRPVGAGWRPARPQAGLPAAVERRLLVFFRALTGASAEGG